MANEMAFVLRKINTADIISNAGYQRPVDVREVRKIVAKWNDNLVNPPKVSYRNGKFYVFDGQHTIQALKLKNDGKDVDVLCRVYTGLTYEDEARLFAEQNGISKRVTVYQKSKALYEAKDEDVMAVSDLIMAYGYPNPTLPSGSKTPSFFRPFPTALKIYMKYGRNRLDMILRIITESWGAKNKDGCRAGIVSGLNLLLNTYMSHELDVRELIRCLSRVSPMKICADAKADTLHKGAVNYAIQMALIYNDKKRKCRLDVRDLLR